MKENFVSPRAVDDDGAESVEGLSLQELNQGLLAVPVLRDCQDEVVRHEGAADDAGVGADAQPDGAVGQRRVGGGRGEAEDGRNAEFFANHFCHSQVGWNTRHQT